MKQRSALKEASLQRILKSGATRLCEEGLSGAGIASVMKDAGLTHGAFYSHFGNKDELQKTIDAICGGEPCDADINAKKFEETVIVQMNETTKRSQPLSKTAVKRLNSLKSP